MADKKFYVNLDLQDSELKVNGTGGNDQVLTTNASGVAELVPKSSLGGSGVTDHTLLTNIGTNTHDQIDSHIADIAIHTDWSQPGAGTIDPSNYVDNDTVYDDTLITASVALNTLKVSADGSIDTHSDVDTTTAPPAMGDQLKWDGTNWVPVTINNGFTVFPIWAEESGPLASGAYEWSWGNGATGNDIGIPLAFDCELFAVSFNADAFGTSVSINTQNSGTTVNTSTFTANNQVENFTPVNYSAGDLVHFQTNAVVGTTTDARVCAWFRVASTVNLPTQDRSVVSGSGIAFTSVAFADIPGISTTVVLTDTGTVDGILNYSALRSGGANSVTQFRVVINGDNGQSFFDTLSTFNDNGSAAHFVENLAAGTYTVTAQALVDQPITITSISLTASAVED